jgi:hypothetical protein
MHLFCNFKGIRLEEQDEQWIRCIADYICRLRFQGLSDDQQRELSRLAAGTLPVHIIRHMRGVRDLLCNRPSEPSSPLKRSRR